MAGEYWTIVHGRHKIFNERNYFLAEGSFFEVFPSLLVQGNPSTCLSDPNAVVISGKGWQRTCSGTTDVVGKTMTYMAKGEPGSAGNGRNEEHSGELTF